MAEGGEKMGAGVFWRTLKQESKDVEEQRGGNERKGEMMLIEYAWIHPVACITLS